MDTEQRDEQTQRLTLAIRNTMRSHPEVGNPKIDDANPNSVELLFEGRAYTVSASPSRVMPEMK